MCSRFLDLSFNKIAALPSSMSSLEKLTSLNLGFNPLDSLPEALCSMQDLRELNIDNSGVSLFALGQVAQVSQLMVPLYIEFMQQLQCDVHGPMLLLDATLA